MIMTTKINFSIQTVVTGILKSIAYGGGCRENQPEPHVRLKISDKMYMYERDSWTGLSAWMFFYALGHKQSYICTQFHSWTPKPHLYHAKWKLSPPPGM